jgi:hypothetical protein
MLIVDIWVLVFLNSSDPSEFTAFEAIIIVLLRTLEQNAVNFYIYYMIYWPYRFNYQSSGYDVDFNIMIEN